MEVIINGEAHVIDARRITIIVPGSNMHHRIRYPEMVEIDLQMSCQHASTVESLHEDIQSLFDLVFPDSNIDLHSTKANDTVQSLGTGMLHVIGRLDLSLKFQDQGVAYMWKYPEACLHPGAQVGLADVMIALRRRGRSKTEVVEEELDHLNRRLNT
jgi:hypothetical protein